MFESLNAFRLRIKTLLHRRRLERDLRDEMAFHMAMREEQLNREGSHDPRASAQRRFGNVTRLQEECREAWTFPSLERWLADIRYAARALRKKPGFTIVAILTLTLGIGANSAVFSAINAVLLRPLPFPNGDRLMILDQYKTKVKNSGNSVAPLRLADWNRLNGTFEALTGYYTEDVSESSGTLPEKITRAWVAPRFFQVWGVPPGFGRSFAPDEERFGGPNATVISDRFWRRRFGSDPDVIGKSLRIAGYTYSIVGIMPASFLFPDHDVDIWCPSPPDAPVAQSRESTWFTVIGRLKPGVTPGKAQADLATVQEQLGKEYPKTDADLAVRIRRLKEVTVGVSGRSLWLLFASVSVLLLIACTNIAALLLARTADREQEISIRLSLGASPTSIVRRLLTEVFLLALAGSVLGLVLAGAASDVLRLLAKNLPRVEEVRLDWTIVTYSLGCAVCATFLCGLFPAIRSVRRTMAGNLASIGRPQTPARPLLQWILVAMQVALSVTLLFGAGLLLRSFQELGRVSAGFDPSHVLTFRISASWAETTDLTALRRRLEGILDSLRTMPGIEDGATSLVPPGVPWQLQGQLKLVEGAADPNRKIIANTRIVSAGYFATMRIPVLSGEPCREGATTPTAVVNRSFADTYLPASSAIGYHVDVVPPNPFFKPAEILGIVADAREEGLNREPMPMIYRCDSAPNPTPLFLVRTSGDPLAPAETIRRKIHEIEPQRSVYDVVPLEDRLDETFAENRLRTILLSFFALTALSLACIGVYGTLSYFVNMRRREIALRIAIGELRKEIASRFLLQGLRVCLLGTLAGMFLAVAAGRGLSTVLYGVSSVDPLTIGGVVLIMLAAGGLSSLLPAIRAARMQPMQLLRDE